MVITRRNEFVKYLIYFIILFYNVKCMEELEGIIPINNTDGDMVLEESYTTPYFLLFIKTLKNEDLEKFDLYFKPFKKAFLIIKEKKVNFKFGIVDSANNKDIAGKFGVEDFPQYRLIFTGSSINYIGGTSVDDILNFIKFKVESPSKEFYIPEDLERYMENKEVVVFFGPPNRDNPNYLQFLDIARKFDDVLFAHCSMTECLEHYHIDWNEMLFFNKVHNRIIELRHPYTDYMIKKLIEDNYTKTLEYFDEWVADFIFVRNNVGMFLFIDKENPEHLKYSLVLKRVAKYFKSIIHFVIVDNKNKYEIELAKITKVKYADMPCVFLYDARQEQIYKYKLEGEITEENLYKFSIDFGLNKLIQYYSSEDIPDESSQGKIVRTLVGKSYGKEIQEDNQNYIFVYFYGDECIHCHKAGILFETSAKYILESNKNIKFYKINYDLNEIPYIEIVGYPNMKLFAPRSRSTPHDYPIDKDRSLVRIAEFLKHQIPNLNISHMTDKLDEDFEINYENKYNNIDKDETPSEEFKDEI